MLHCCAICYAGFLPVYEPEIRSETLQLLRRPAMPGSEMSAKYASVKNNIYASDACFRGGRIEREATRSSSTFPMMEPAAACVTSSFTQNLASPAMNNMEELLTAKHGAVGPSRRQQGCFPFLKCCLTAWEQLP